MAGKIYFGHPINTYDTDLEKKLLLQIHIAFPGLVLENPNQDHHQKGYRLWKELYGHGMSYYYQEVLPKCVAGIFLPFRDGKWGAGVLGEAEILASLGRPIFEITNDGVIREINNLQDIPSLTIDETRQRIRTKEGEIIPY